MNRTFEKFLLGLVVVSGLTALSFAVGAAGYWTTLQLFTLLGVVDMEMVLMVISLVVGTIAATIMIGMLLHDAGEYFEDMASDRCLED